MHGDTREVRPGEDLDWSALASYLRWHLTDGQVPGLRLNEALTMIRGALRSEPDNPAYLDSLGWVLFKLARHKEAVVPLQRAVKLLDAPDATVLDHLGDVLHALGRKSEAREAWVESEKVEKSDAVRHKIETTH